jgi:hypothetical protein
MMCFLRSLISVSGKFSSQVVENLLSCHFLAFFCSSYDFISMIIKNNNTALTYGMKKRKRGREIGEKASEIVTVCEITIKLTTLKISRVETMNSSIKLIWANNF